MDFLRGLEVEDTKNKKWGKGKLSIQNNQLMAYYLRKPGFKYEKYDYPLDFEKRLNLLTDDKNIKQTIEYDIWMAKADKESLAFKYNYCDGGSSDSKIGFDGVCSDECIKCNIENAGRAWCSISPCKKYLDGEKTREEIEKEYRENEFFCYESRLMKTWEAGIGVDNDGRPRRIGSNVKDGLAIMTTTRTTGDEKNRCIFAVFLIRSQEFGDEHKEGFVSAVDGDKPVYSVVLTKQESSKMRFWDYYSNPNEPEKIMWGTGLYRFISHDQAARILQDIIDIKDNPEEKASAKELLDLFCKMHGITEIPNKSGALSRRMKDIANC